MQTRKETRRLFRYDRYYEAYSEGAVVSNPHYVNTFNYVDFVERGGAIPHWRKLIANGQNASTFQWGVRYQLSKQDGFVRFTRTRSNPALNPAIYPNLEYIARGPICYLDLPPVGSINRQTSYNRASNQALTRYYSHVADVDTHFKGMVFTGELKESLSMIKSPAKSFRKGVGEYLEHIKRYARRMPRRKRPKFIRDTWLEYSFGWKPLISDLDSAIKTFYSSDLVRPIFQMVSGRGNDSLLTNMGSQQGTNGPSIWNYKIKCVEDFEIRYYGVYSSRGNGALDNHSYGFAPSEFIPTVWELIPYSFLVDYFTNVGDIISSWSYRFIASDWTTESQRTGHYYTTYDEKLAPAPNNDDIWHYSSTGDPGRVSFSRIEVYRNPNVGTKLPSFEVQVPGMGSVKWLNLLALSVQLDGARKSVRS